LHESVNYEWTYLRALKFNLERLRLFRLKLIYNVDSDIVFILVFIYRYCQKNNKLALKSKILKSIILSFCGCNKIK
jgi:hypothetical protein